MDIELVEIDNRGNGYAVIHRDDASTFGLNFQGAPLTSAEATLDFIRDRALEVDVPVQAPSVAPVPANVRNLLSKRTPARARA